MQLLPTSNNLEPQAPVAKRNHGDFSVIQTRQQGTDMTSGHTTQTGPLLGKGKTPPLSEKGSSLQPGSSSNQLALRVLRLTLALLKAVSARLRTNTLLVSPLSKKTMLMYLPYPILWTDGKAIDKVVSSKISTGAVRSISYQVEAWCRFARAVVNTYLWEQVQSRWQLANGLPDSLALANSHYFLWHADNLEAPFAQRKPIERKGTDGWAWLETGCRRPGMCLELDAATKDPEDSEDDGEDSSDLDTATEEQGGGDGLPPRPNSATYYTQSTDWIVSRGSTPASYRVIQPDALGSALLFYDLVWVAKLSPGLAPLSPQLQSHPGEHVHQELITQKLFPVAAAGTPQSTPTEATPQDETFGDAWRREYLAVEEDDGAGDGVARDLGVRYCSLILSWALEQPMKFCGLSILPLVQAKPAGLVATLKDVKDGKLQEYAFLPGQEFLTLLGVLPPRSRLGPPGEREGGEGDEDGGGESGESDRESEAEAGTWYDWWLYPFDERRAREPELETTELCRGLVKAAEVKFRGRYVLAGIYPSLHVAHLILNAVPDKEAKCQSHVLLDLDAHRTELLQWLQKNGRASARPHPYKEQLPVLVDVHSVILGNQASKFAKLHPILFKEVFDQNEQRYQTYKQTCENVLAWDPDKDGEGGLESLLQSCLAQLKEPEDEDVVANAVLACALYCPQASIPCVGRRQGPQRPYRVLAAAAVSQRNQRVLLVQYTTGASISMSLATVNEEDYQRVFSKEKERQWRERRLYLLPLCSKQVSQARRGLLCFAAQQYVLQVAAGQSAPPPFPDNEQLRTQYRTAVASNADNTSLFGPDGEASYLAYYQGLQKAANVLGGRSFETELPPLLAGIVLSDCVQLLAEPAPAVPLAM